MAMPWPMQHTGGTLALSTKEYARPQLSKAVEAGLSHVTSHNDIATASLVVHLGAVCQLGTVSTLTHMSHVITGYMSSQSTGPT